MRFTIFGCQGVIGSALVEHLRLSGHEVIGFGRGDTLVSGFDYGHIIYCIGLTGDFRNRIDDTVDSHVVFLMQCLRSCVFESFLYLSSSRLYGVNLASESVNELTPVSVLPGADAVYDASKLLGECLCLSQSSEKVRVARVSNVYGTRMSSYNFLGSVVESIKRTSFVILNETLDSAKDYLSLTDLVLVLPKIALLGKSRLYVVASGVSTRHGDLMVALNCRVPFDYEVSATAARRRFSVLDIGLLRDEFDFHANSLLEEVDILFRE